MVWLYAYALIMMKGRKPIPEVVEGVVKRNRALILPKIEKPAYQQMYAYYQGMGSNRSLSKVAQHFNKSKNYMGLLARAFNWRERITKFENTPRDPVVMAVVDKIDASRKNLVEVVHEVVDTLHELMYISKGIRDGKSNDEVRARQVQLNLALKVWGFDWKTPKDFTALVKTLKEVKDFNADDNSKNLAGLHAQQFNIDEFNLVVKDD